MPRHTPQERLAILDRRKNVATRYLRGQTQWEIARAFEVTQQTISLDLKAIQAEWLAQAALDRGEWTARELAKIDQVELSAWMAWAKSQENAEILRAKMRGEQSETEKISKGQAGDARFLEIVLKCVERRCKILGLDAPKKHKHEHLSEDGRNILGEWEQLRQMPADELTKIYCATIETFVEDEE